MILPPAMAMLDALENVSAPKSVKTSPPWPKPWSRLPSLLNRASAKSSTLLPSIVPWAVPATTILPSGSIATAEAVAATDPEAKPVKTVPPSPKSLSRLPSAL